MSERVQKILAEEQGRLNKQIAELTSERDAAASRLAELNDYLSGAQTELDALLADIEVLPERMKPGKVEVKEVRRARST